MSRTIDVSVPDIGDFKDVPVVEVLVKPGQSVSKEAPLVVLESEKASMEVPSTASGTVRDVKVRVGDKVSEGTVLLTIAANGDASAARDEKPAASPAPAPPESAASAGGTTIDLVVPDIGDFKDVPVVEVLVKPGQTIVKEAPLAVLESEKASMEVPASAAGTIADRQRQTRRQSVARQRHRNAANQRRTLKRKRPPLLPRRNRSHKRSRRNRNLPQRLRPPLRPNRLRQPAACMRARRSGVSRANSA